VARPKKKYTDAVLRERHERALAKRRENAARKKTLAMAAKAAEGQADFDALIAAEKARQSEAQALSDKRRNGGLASPKVTAKARDDLALAFELMGGVPALVVWGRANPTEFYRIWSRLIPKPVEDASHALPLETLLEKLASREALSVREAAIQVGEELLEEGRLAAEAEDVAAATKFTIN
jgi:hypothetical protein